MKSIIVSEETHSNLIFLKYKLGYKSLNELIQELVKGYKSLNELIQELVKSVK